MNEMLSVLSETHRSAYCEECQREIKPGDTLWAKDGYVFCCTECATNHLTKGLKCYEPDDYGYNWHFPIDWDKAKRRAV